MTTTLIAAGLMGLWHLALTWNVISNRRRTGTVNGAQENDPSSRLYRSIRAHGNNAEYTPLLLILLAMLDYGGAPNIAVLAYAALIVLSRGLHGIGMGFTDGSVAFYRMAGTLGTLLSLAAGSFAALILAFKLY